MMNPLFKKNSVDGGGGESIGNDTILEHNPSYFVSPIGASNYSMMNTMGASNIPMTHNVLYQSSDASPVPDSYYMPNVPLTANIMYASSNAGDANYAPYSISNHSNRESAVYMSPYHSNISIGAAIGGDGPFYDVAGHGDGVYSSAFDINGYAVPQHSTNA